MKSFLTLIAAACATGAFAADASYAANFPVNSTGNKDSIILDHKKSDEKFVEINAISLSFKNPKKDYQEFAITEGSDVEEKMEEAELKRFKKDLKKEKRELQEGEYEPSKKGESISIDHTVFTDDANEMLKKSGFIDTVNLLFPDNVNTQFLEGKIIRISEFSVTRGRKVPTPFYYKFKVTMRWYLKNVYDETIDSTDIISLSNDLDFASVWLVTSENMVATVQSAVNASLKAVLKSDLVRSTNTVVTDYRTTFDKLVITSPKGDIKKDMTQDATVTISVKNGHGSGFAVSNDGYIITNFHVIAGEKLDEFPEVKVIDSKGNETVAKIVRYNRNVDLALLKVDKSFTASLRIPAAKNYNPLQTVYAIGTPKSKELGQSISAGIISNERHTKGMDLIQLSMSVNGGNSGGPVIDDKGLLCGVVVAKLYGWGTEGISFAIPSHKIFEYLNISY